MKKSLVLFLSFFLVGSLQLFAGRCNFSGSVVAVGSKMPIKEYEIQVIGTYRMVHVADLGGRFGFANLEPGEYLVSVMAEGFEKYVISIPIPDGKEVHYQFYLAKSETKEKPRTDFLGAYSLTGFSFDYSADLLRSIPQDPERPLESILELNPNYLFDKNLIRPFKNSSYQYSFTSPFLTTDINFSETNLASPFSGNYPDNAPTPSVSGLSGISETVMYSLPEAKNEAWSVDMEPNRGKDNGFDMFFKVSFGLPALNGSMHNDLRIEQVGTDNRLITVDGGPKLLGRGEFSFEYGISGELPGANKGSTFALSVRNYSQDHDYGLDVYDAAGNNLGAMPGQNSLIRNVNTNFKIVLDHRTRVYADAMFAATTKENSSTYWLYATDKQSVQTGKTTAIERQMKQNALNIQYDRIAAAIEFDVPSAFTLRLGFARNGYEYKYGRRSNGDDANWANGYDMYQPTDRYSTAYSNRADSLVLGGNGVLDNYERLFKSDSSVDRFYRLNTPKVNPLTGFADYDRDGSTDNPYGFRNNLLSTSFDPRGDQDYRYSQDGVQYEKMENYKANLSISKQFDLWKTKHDLSVGFEFSYSILKRFVTLSPYSLMNADIYTDEFEFKSGNTDLLSQDENRTPIQWDLTLFDQVKFGNWTFAPSVKATFINPGFKGTPLLTWSKIENATDFALSPSIFVSFRPSEGTCLSATAASYNVPLPYEDYLTDFFRREIGQPSMGLINSKHIMFSLDQSLYENLSLRSSVFWNWFQVPELHYIKAIPDPYSLYRLSAEDGTKNLGANCQLFYRLNNNWNMSLLLSFLHNNQFDLFVGTEQFAYNAILTYSLGRFEGPSFGEFFPLAGMSISLVSKMQPGNLQLDLSSRGFINGDGKLQCQNTYSIDMRISKMFYFADLFPSLTGGSGIEISLDIINLFDFTKPLRYNQATYDPDKTITLRTTPATLVGTSTYYQNANVGSPITFSADQYDNFGRRLYNAAADFDQDGKVTTDERYKAFFNYYETTLRQRLNYQLPRRVFMSVALKF